MAGKRHRKSDERSMYVISPTISNELREMIVDVAIATGQPRTAVTRVAIKLGMMRMAQAMKKRDAGDATVWDAIVEDIGTDGRRTAKQGNC